MKKIKQCTAWLLSVLMVASLGACMGGGSGSSDASITPEESSESSSLVSEESSPEESSPEESSPEESSPEESSPEESSPEETSSEEEEEEEKEIPKYLTTKADKAGRVTLDKTSDVPADFVLNVEGDEEIKILQITDTQMIDPLQLRRGYNAISDRYLDHDACIYDIVTQVVEATQPDLILLTGDYVYGDYDDNGTLFREQTDYFDSLGIYWAPIFGNHDNDSDSLYSSWVDPEYPDWFARKQCQYFEKAEYCLFKTRAEITGFSNYSLAIQQNDELVRSVFMLDTHGSMSSTQGLTTAQIDWYKAGVDAINEYAGKEIPNFVGIHVPLRAFADAAAQYNFVSGTKMEIPENDNGDEGFLASGIGKSCDSDYKAFNAFKAKGADAILAGHLHMNNASILYQGVRLVFGTKSSTYDKYDAELLGGTLFTLGENNSFEVDIVYYDKNK